MKSISINSTFNTKTFADVEPGEFYIAENGTLYQRVGTGKIDVAAKYGKRTVGFAIRSNDGRGVWHRLDKKVQPAAVSLDVEAL